MASSLFTIEMLPVRQGDALWIEYGDKRRILIDGGPMEAYKSLEKKLKTLEENDKIIELVVISHVDTDHIEGIIRVFAEDYNNWLFKPNDIWFNGWRHLKESDILGGREGDFLSALITRRAAGKWNSAFEMKPIVIEPDKPLPVVELKDGMKLTILSPNYQKLKAMASKWEEDLIKYELKPGDLEKAWEQLTDPKKYKKLKGVLGGENDAGERLKKQLSTDQSAANGSSIAFLAEFEGKSCLFLGDAHHDIITESIRKLLGSRGGKLKVGAVKISHHGSRHNISKELISLIDAEHFLFSTNGDKFRHPNKPAVEAVIQWSEREPTLWFNYKTKYSEIWDKSLPQSGKKYKVRYPQNAEGGIIVEL